MAETPAWLRREISSGLQALVALSLKNQPAAEVLPLTADIWLRAVQRGSVGCDIESIDAPRIREGFEQLFPRLREWPTPVDLLDRIPGRPEREKLPEPPRSAEQEAVGRRALMEIEERLKAAYTLPELPRKDEEETRRHLRRQAETLQKGARP